MPAMVVVPTANRPARLVRASEVHSIICHRVKNKVEEYLVRWKTTTAPQTPPLSWHNLEELSRCLLLLQDYLDNRKHEVYLKAATLTKPSMKKRKSPDAGIANFIERRPSPFGKNLSVPSPTPSSERSPSVGSTGLVSEATASTATTFSSGSEVSLPTRQRAEEKAVEKTVDVYNATIRTVDGYVSVRYAIGIDIPIIQISNVPTMEMAFKARRAPTVQADTMIKAAYVAKLANVPGPSLHLTNNYDNSSPSLRFKFIADYVLREGVYRADPATQMGCQQCSPHMGRSIGCEYTKKCDCLEYAAVDEKRLNQSEREQYALIKASGGSTIGLPKKFPYFADGVKNQKAGCLVGFYLNSRRPIYECNDNCKCGPYCRNKLVQFGRTIELEIFKTQNRGWALRALEDLHAGQFIDTYRGEIITDEEATRREEASSKAKASYLYSLDKFAESEDLAPEEIYVVDGEFIGGPTKFMNHSCEPNCRQYTVSYNKHDCKVYDIAFFASRDIPKGEELTFDYLDKEEGEEMDEPGEGAIPCLCGTKRCRKWLWM